MAMDVRSFEAFVRTHQAEIYRYLRYLGADRAWAEDLVQDAFLAAYDKPGPLAGEDEPRRAAAWLRGIARKKFLMHCRRARTNPVTANSDVLRAREAAWASEFLRDSDGFDYVEALRACLETLSEKSRGAVDLRYAKKTSRAQMARALAMSEDGVKSLMRRIREALGACVEKRLGVAVERGT
jgi:RNA polymerase sigma-70 factor (ECF subfamily)